MTTSLNQIEIELTSLQKSALEAIALLSDLEALEQLRVNYLY